MRRRGRSGRVGRDGGSGAAAAAAAGDGRGYCPWLEGCGGDEGYGVVPRVRRGDAGELIGGGVEGGMDGLEYGVR